MKLNKNLLFNWLFTIVYMIVIFYYLKNIVQPELNYHLQQPPFLTTIDFFHQYLLYPGGLEEYLSNFLTQFFYYGWPGVIIILLSGIGLMLLSLKIFKYFNINGIENILMFIPAILMFSMFNNYYFQYAAVLKILLIYLTTWSFILIIKNGFNIFLFLPVLSIVLYYLLGGNSLLLFLINVTIITYYNFGLKKGTIFLGLSAMIYLLVPYISFKYIYNISFNDSYFAFFPDTASLNKYRSTNLFKIFFYFMPLTLAVISLIIKLRSNRISNQKSGTNTKIDQPHNKRNRLINIWHTNFGIGSLLVMLIIPGTYYLFLKTHNQHEKNILLSDYYCYTEQWDRVIELAISDSKYDVLMNYNYNRAIDNTGHFLDLFFEYPQLLGSDGLFFDKLNMLKIALISSDYYYDLGYISQSIHWAHEAQSALPYSPRVLKRLTLANIIDGNYEAARKFLTVLDENFMYKDFVNKYMPYIDDTTLIAKDSVLYEKRNQIPDYNHVPANISEILYQLFEKDPHNRKAYEHMQMSYLLDHKMGLFLKFYPLSHQFYKVTPKIFEQALMLYMLKRGDNKLTEFKLSESTLNIARGYFEILNQYKNDRTVLKGMLAGNYANTYFYYVMFTSPHVTKNKLKVSDGTEY